MNARLQASAEESRAGTAVLTAALAEGERELVRRAQSGDTAAYEALVKRNQSRVFAIVSGILRRREDIDDVAQQVFLKAYLSLKRFDLRSAFSTWLYKIAVNECCDYLRKKKVRRLTYEADLSEEQVRRLESLEPGAIGVGQVAAVASDAAKQAEQRQAVDWLLGKLEDDERMMLVLKEVEGYSVEEIAGMLEMNVNTVKVRMFRARGRLMEAFRKRQAQSRRNRE